MSLKQTRISGEILFIGYYSLACARDGSYNKYVVTGDRGMTERLTREYQPARRTWAIGSVVALCVAAVLTAPARADIIFDHQPHPYGGPSSDTLFTTAFGQPYWQRLADDFVLGSADQAIGLTYWGFYDADNPPATETMRIRILRARAGDLLPDENNVVSETTIQNPSREATGRIIQVGIGPHEYRYQASLVSPVDLEAATKYWIEVVQIGDITTKFRWEDSVTDLDGISFINPAVVDWRSSLPGAPADTAFQLISPEPASVVLLALGLCHCARRHRRGREASEWK